MNYNGYNNNGLGGTPYKPYSDSIGSESTKITQSTMEMSHTIFRLNNEVEIKNKEIARLKNENKRILKENSKLQSALSFATKLIIGMIKTFNKELGAQSTHMVIEDKVMSEIKDEDSIEITRNERLYKTSVKIK